jgi:WD40 repeat protein
VARRELPCLDLKRGAVSSLAYSPDGETLVSVGMNHRVNFWNANDQSATSRPTLQLDAQAVGVAYGRSGRRIFAAGPDNSVSLWTNDSKEDVLSLPCGTKRMVSVAVAADGNRIAAVDCTGNLRIWAAKTAPEDAERKWAFNLIRSYLNQVKVSKASNRPELANATYRKAIESARRYVKVFPEDPSIKALQQEMPELKADSVIKPKAQ